MLVIDMREIVPPAMLLALSFEGTSLLVMVCSRGHHASEEAFVDDFGLDVKETLSVSDLNDSTSLW